MDPVPTHVIVVGVGSIGCSLLPLLVGMGPLRLTLVDGDTVEAANLVRQTLYGPSDVGRLKVEVAAERLAAIASGTSIRTIPHFLDGGNAERHIANSTVVLDATDDLHVKYLLDRTCRALGVPLITGAVHHHQFQVATLHVPGATGGTFAGLHELFPGPRTGEQDSCDMRSVPVHVTALCAAVMAMRLRDLLHGVHALIGTVDLIDVQGGRWLRLAIPSPPHSDELIAAFASGTDHA
jgi:sulfur-carrier protein adenylyltransferase/sulfurtransferase